MIEQIGRIARVLRHGERTVDDARLAKTALVVGENGCKFAQPVDDRRGTLEGCAGTVEEKDTRAGARKFVMNPHAGPENMPLYSVGFSIGGSFS